MSDIVYYDVLQRAVERYREMLNQSDHPMNHHTHMTLDILQYGIEKRHPLTRLNRQLGCIQGIMIERGLISMGDEVEWMQSVFNPLDLLLWEKGDANRLERGEEIAFYGIAGIFIILMGLILYGIS